MMIFILTILLVISLVLNIIGITGLIAYSQYAQEKEGRVLKSEEISKYIDIWKRNRKGKQ